jgi:hypothetical protein
MTWSEKDEVLFNTINIFGKEHLEAQIEDASEKFSRLKQRPNFFVIFGYYNLDADIFVWQNEMNKISYDFVKNNYMSLFKSDETIKKLFKPAVKFTRKDMNVIPYLMEALNAQFNVVRFKSPTTYIYALTTVDDVKETFKYQELNDAMFIYRYLDEIDKKYGNKHKKSKNKRRNSTRRKRKERV